MTVILVPEIGEGMVLNWWNWRPTVALMVRANILPVAEIETIVDLSTFGHLLFCSWVLL